MEKIGRIRKRLGNFKNILHLFLRRRPLAAVVAHKRSLGREKFQYDKGYAG